MSWAIDLRGQVGALRLALRLEAPEGSLTVIGPNGAGKTTLLRAIAGAPTALKGRIEVGGRALLDTARGVALPPHARRIGYVPQGLGLFEHLTALDNVAFGCPRGRRGLAQALSTLERFGAGELADRFPSSLSGGERQRVALARAFAPTPEAMLLDEPLSALDPALRRQTRALLVEVLGQARLPAIVVTHDARDVRALGGLVAVVEGGAVVQVGTMAQLVAAPASPFVEEFFDILSDPKARPAP